MMIAAVGGPGAVVTVIIWLIRLEGKHNRLESVVEERSLKSFERQQGMQKQVDELREMVVDTAGENSEKLSSLLSQVGKLEGMISVLITKFRGHQE